MIPLVESDGCLGPPESHRGSEGVDSVHLLLGDAVLPAGLVHLGALEDHEAAIGLKEFGVVLYGSVRWLASLQGRLLGLALLAEGAMDVAPDGGTIFEEVLRLPPMEQEGGLKSLLEVLGACTSPVGLRPSNVVGRNHHLLPMVLLVLVLLVMASLG